MTKTGDIPNFEFGTAARIVFGAGRLRELGPIAAGFGKRALVVTGKGNRAIRRAEQIWSCLREGGVESVMFPISGEPTLEVVRAGTQRARDENCELVISLGGGSAIDAGKAIAALLANGGDPLDYVEVIGRGQPVTKLSVPFIAIPTTAGAGAEVTFNAVLGAPEHKVKVSIRSRLMLARVALVDPELTHDLPPELTASTGLDALTQLIEPFVSGRANPLTDMICREGIRRVARSLRHACECGDDIAAREDLALASLLGGMALANAGLGAVHGFAAPLGGMFPAPHGAVCARLLPFVIETNVVALRQRSPTSNALPRYELIACLLTGTDQAKVEDGLAWLRDLSKALKIRPLGDYGVKSEHLTLLIAKAAEASSMKGNTIALTEKEMRGILERAL